jgi:hypothetical protein
MAEGVTLILNHVADSVHGLTVIYLNSTIERLPEC